MTLIDSVRDYIIQCPHLKTFEDIMKVYVDYTKSDEATTYSINEGIGEPILKKYIDGSTERQFLFSLTSVEFYGSDVSQNISNVAFYENFSKWLEEQSKLKNFPVLDSDKKALKIEALSNGYLFGNAENGETAIYRIQMKLTYFQNK